MKILFIPLEFPTWADASHFPYPANYGIEEGFAASGVEYATLPALFGTTPSDSYSWLHYARQIFEGERFDQVWIEIVHSTYDEEFLAWVKSVAPVRIGFCWESCEMDSRERVNNPEGAERRQRNLAKNLPFMTHLVMIDERDVEAMNAEGKVRAKWIYDAGFVPRRFVSGDFPRKRTGRALFFGTLYGDRKSWLEHPELKDLLVRPEASGELDTPLPRMFNDLHAIIMRRLSREGPGGAKKMLPEYLDAVRTVRREAFSLWLGDLKGGSAVVNLPQFAKAYAGRVLEGMATGRPVVTWEIPDRPRTRALFRDGEEILLYPKDDPGALAAHLRRLRDEPGLAERIARNAMRKLREGHTIELLVQQILAWVEGKDQASKGKGEDCVRGPAPPSHSPPHPDAGAAVASSISPGDLVFDVGANLGAKAEKFLSLGARVVCIEPQSKMVETLRGKFREMGAVTVVGKALSDSPCVLTMSICDEAPTISTFSEEWMHGRFSEYRWDRKERVEATTLDLLVQEFGVPKYCKIDVEGFELQVLRGLTKPVPLLSFEFTKEFFSNALRCIEYLSILGYRDFNFSLAESETFSFSSWVAASEVIRALEKIEDPLLWGDIYARFQPEYTRPAASVPDAPPAELSPDAFLREAAERGLWRKGEPLRLHLGCGEIRMDGYVNVDYPPSEHNVMRTVADVHADIAKLVLPDRSIDEIRLHHVFEHFNRVTALALLIRWHGWLKVGGKLVIETPDIVGSAKTLLSDVPLVVKMGVVRHLAGDQAARWAYHVDHWFPERFEHTLSALGFDGVVASTSSWPMPPYLSNVEVTARKDRTVRIVDQLAAADRLLLESTVAPAEKPTWEIWRRQLRDALQDGGKPESLPDRIPVACKETARLEETYRFYEENLLCPETHERLRHRGCFLESRSGRKYRMENGIPCFVGGDLTESQKSELEFTENYIREIIEGKNTLYDPGRIYAQVEVCWKWATPWVNGETVTSDTRIICVGGSFVDDLPHVESSYKFNVDPLAHRYFGIHPELCEANTHYIVASAEKLPFGNEYADIVYMRNSLDHTANPIKCLQEVHRVLKGNGRLFLGVYFNSSFINEHESTVIDEEFLSSNIDPLFHVEHREIQDVQQQRSIGGKKTGFMHLVCRKRPGGTLRYTEQEIMTVGKILAFFHSALCEENRRRPEEAAHSYGEILPLEPVLPTDFHRVVYAYIRWCGIRNPKVLPILYSLYRKMGFSALWEEVFQDAAKGNIVLLPPSSKLEEDWDGFVKHLDISGKISGWRILFFLARTMEEEGNSEASEIFRGWIPPGVSSREISEDRLFDRSTRI